MLSDRGVRNRRWFTMVLLGTAFAVPVAFAQDLPLLQGTDGDDVVTGTDAGESIYGRAGNDRIDGAGGDDELDGGPGADVLGGGPGRDAVSYGGATGVTVTVDGQPDDGAPGEGDNVSADVEDLFGTDANDDLTGSGGENAIDGSGGNDIIAGGNGSDALFGGDGNDDITANDGKVDRVDCGAGSRDRATIDRIDIVTGCEDRREPVITRIFRVSQLFPRGGRRASAMLLTGLTNRSSVVVACIRGCRPATSPRIAVVRRRSVTTRDSAARITLTRRVIAPGATIEVGVRAPRAGPLCVRFRVGSSRGRLGRLVRVRNVRCTSVARSG